MGCIHFETPFTLHSDILSPTSKSWVSFEDSESYICDVTLNNEELHYV